MLTRIHHITFLVRDLDAACRRYEQALGLGPFIRETLNARGVETARARIGESWLVLARPSDPDGAPGRHLAAHGEGLFLMSFGVEDLERSIEALEGSAMPALTKTRRRGVAGWEVVDLAASDAGGSVLQLAQD